jgi:hypothetical protein
VTLALHGYSPAEFVAETGVAQRTMFRVLVRMKQTLGEGQEVLFNNGKKEP